MSVSGAGPAACPFCGGGDTELSNAFGPHASVSTWWCRQCRSPFETFKWGTHPDDLGATTAPAPSTRSDDRELDDGHE